MLNLIKSGVKIKIIHNVNRKRNELIQALTGWLPLYQTGMIEPYYFDEEQTSIFSHTLFINPNGYAITSLSVSGTEDKCIYHYHTDKNECSLLCDNYALMLENAYPLIELSYVIPEKNNGKSYVYNGINIIITKKAVYLVHIETGANIGFKHPMLIDAFYDFCNNI